MIFTELPLKGAYLIDLEKKGDDRGFFARYFCENEFALHGLEIKWKQINNSFTAESGTLRGLHFQKPEMSEVKLVRCIKGSIWDVIVDIRRHSETYGKWFGTELSENNRTMMYVPKGFAHGFITLTDNCEMLYLVSEFYSAAHEGTLRWNDPFHGIEWPLEPQLLSDKDKAAPDWTPSSSLTI